MAGQFPEQKQVPREALCLTDGIRILNFLFSGDEPPASPFPDCGIDPTQDELTCESYFSCR